MSASDSDDDGILCEISDDNGSSVAIPCQVLSPFFEAEVELTSYAPTLKFIVSLKPVQVGIPEDVYDDESAKCSDDTTGPPRSLLLPFPINLVCTTPLPLEQVKTLVLWKNYALRIDFRSLL